MVNFPKKLPVGGRNFPSNSEIDSDTGSPSRNSDDEDVGPANHQRANVAPGSSLPQRSGAEFNAQTRHQHGTDSLGQTSDSLGVSAVEWLQSEQRGMVEMHQSPTPQFPQGRVWLSQTSPLPQVDPEALADVARMREESILARQLETPSISDPRSAPTSPEGRAQSSLALEVPAHLMDMLEALATPTPAHRAIPGSPGRDRTDATAAFAIPSSPEPEEQLNWHPENVLHDDGAYIVGPAPTAEAIANLRDAILVAVDQQTSWLDDEYRTILIQNLGLEESVPSDLKLVASAVDLWQRQEASGVEPDMTFSMTAYDAVENLGDLALTTPEVARALDEFTNVRPALPLVAQRCVQLYNAWNERAQDAPDLSTFLQCGPMLLDIANKLNQFDEPEEVPPQLDESSETNSGDVQSNHELGLDEDMHSNHEFDLDDDDVQSGHGDEDEIRSDGSDSDRESVRSVVETEMDNSSEDGDSNESDALSEVEFGDPNQNPVTLEDVVDAARAVSYQAGQTILDYCFRGGQVGAFPPGQPPAPPQ